MISTDELKFSGVYSEMAEEENEAEESAEGLLLFGHLSN